MNRSNEPRSDIFTLVRQIAAIIDAGKKKITNRELLHLCAASGIPSLSNDTHLCHEIAEVAINHLICSKYGEDLLSSVDPAAACAETLRPLQGCLPTQSWRSETQITFQQFSTPASIAYLAAYLLNLTDTDTVLEPSCGTGSLAVWALLAGSTVVSNEIDPRRRDLAALVGLNPTGHDAEFIDDLLPESVVPSVILANPPFSSSGGRVERNQSKFGFRHVESALRRLAPGGRFAFILGESGSPNRISGRRFWQSLKPNIQVSAAIELPGSEYYRNGTTVRVTLLIGNKLSGQELGSAAMVNDPVTISASSVEDAFRQVLAKDLRFQPTAK
ncbi:MAG: SAM-dependent DNA methyltransferase [Acidobacteria bacterium]|nr:SAM-dependent DNA methyltransferase [Acidobacteriota bacterium]